jgi:NAD kinase
LSKTIVFSVSCRVLAAKERKFERALIAVVSLPTGSRGFLSKALISETTKLVGDLIGNERKDGTARTDV